MRDLVSLPKAELHIHLEGSIRVGTVRELADRMGRPAPAALGPNDVWRFGGFEHFIDSYGQVCDLLNDLDDFRRVAVEFCEILRHKESGTPRSSSRRRSTPFAWVTGSGRSRPCSMGSRPANATTRSSLGWSRTSSATSMRKGTSGRSRSP